MSYLKTYKYMKLKPKHNILDILELDIPALIETKEGKLLGGFCTIPVAGFDVFAKQDDCQSKCQTTCQDGCQIKCKHCCLVDCESTPPPTPTPTDDTTPTTSTQSLIGLSFMF
jgi:hypothetical protein